MKTLLLISLLPFSLMAADCEKKDIKIIFARRPIVTQEVVCEKKSPDSMLFYVSKSCVDNKCDVLKRRKIELPVPNYHGNIGSPGFKLCEKLGGVPQIFEFKKPIELTWQSTERCLFSNKDFVEISLLIKEWKSFVTF